MIKEFIKSTSQMSLIHKKSIEIAEDMLSEDESLIYVLACNYSYTINDINIKTNATKNAGIIVLTSKRIYFCSSILKSTTSDEIQLFDICKFDSKHTLLKNTIYIDTLDFSLIITDFLGKILNDFMNALFKAVKNTKAQISNETLIQTKEDKNLQVQPKNEVKEEIKEEAQQLNKKQKHENNCIAEFLNSTSQSILFYKKTVEIAESMLLENEEFIYALVCTYLYSANESNIDIQKDISKRTGIVVLTSKRLYFCDNFFNKINFNQIPLTELISVDNNYKTGTGSGLDSVTRIYTEYKLLSITNIKSRHIFDLTRILSKEINKTRELMPVEQRKHQEMLYQRKIQAEKDLQKQQLELQEQKRKEDLYNFQKEQLEVQKQQLELQKQVQESMLKCPKCGSTSLSGQKEGYGVVKGGLGRLVGSSFGNIGAIIGAGVGNIGSQDVTVTCMNCGHRFKPRKK